MAKAILEFDLSRRDDRYCFHLAVKAGNLLAALNNVAKQIQDRIEEAEKSSGLNVAGLTESQEILWEVVKECEVASLMV